MAYIVWTNPSSAKGRNPATKSTKMAVGGIMTPVITRSILGSVPIVPLGGTISLTATAGGALRQVKNLDEGMSSTGRRKTVTRRFGDETYYEHGVRSNKASAMKQAASLRKVGYRVRVTKA